MFQTIKRLLGFKKPLDEHEIAYQAMLKRQAEEKIKEELEQESCRLFNAARKRLNDLQNTLEFDLFWDGLKALEDELENYKRHLKAELPVDYLRCSQEEYNRAMGVFENPDETQRRFDEFQRLFAETKLFFHHAKSRYVESRSGSDSIEYLEGTFGTRWVADKELEKYSANYNESLDNTQASFSQFLRHFFEYRFALEKKASFALEQCADTQQYKPIAARSLSDLQGLYPHVSETPLVSVPNGIDQKILEGSILPEASDLIKERFHLMVKPYQNGDLLGFGKAIQDEIAFTIDKRSCDNPRGFFYVVELILADIYRIPMDWKVPRIYLESAVLKEYSQYWMPGIVPQLLIYSLMFDAALNTSLGDSYLNAQPYLLDLAKRQRYQYEMRAAAYQATVSSVQEEPLQRQIRNLNYELESNKELQEKTCKDQQLNTSEREVTLTELRSEQERIESLLEALK